MQVTLFSALWDSHAEFAQRGHVQELASHVNLQAAHRRLNGYFCP